MHTTTLVKPTGSRGLKSSRVTLSPGEEVGEHVTEKREEIIIVLKGSGSLISEGKEIPMREGDVHYIKENTRHNVRSGAGILEYVYVVNIV